MTFVRTINEKAVQIVGARGSALETARGRLMVMAVFFALVFSGISFRVMHLCLWQQGAEPRYEIVRVDSDKADALAVGRADIVDRNGALLATTLQTMSLYADPKIVDDGEVVTRDLVKIFADIDGEELRGKLNGKRRFVWIKRGVTPEEIAAVNALGHPGLNFSRENRRFYPQEELLSHIVGYTDVDGRGLAGIERGMDSVLRRGGAPLRLSVDVRFQHVLRRSIADAMRKFSARGAVGVITDVKTGEVLAAVSLPDFDPHRAGEASADSRFNRFALGVYEMGSTFKTFSTAALLDQVDASIGQRFDASKPIKRGRFTISDYHAQNREMNVPEVFMHSSNIGSAMMGEKIGTERLKRFYGDLGLTTPLQVAFPEKGAPLVPNPWSDISTLTATYGHGIAVTPLHIIRAFAAIVNGGTLPKIHILADQYDEMRPRVISEKTSDVMRRLLRLVVTHGTGSKADIPGAAVAGKTGTAEKSSAKGYSKDKVIASFIGTFPANDPRYAVFVVVDEPQGIKETHGYATGGWVAAPVVGDVARSIVRLLNMDDVDEVYDQRLEQEMTRYIKLQPSKIKTLATYQR